MLNTNISVQHLVDWVIAHRREKAFLNWTPDEIAVALQEAIISKECLVCFDKDDSNTILGIVHGRAYPKEKVFYVCNLLVMPHTKGVISSFLRGMSILWPGFKLEGTRYGKIKHYDTPRFIKHINHLT